MFFTGVVAPTPKVPLMNILALDWTTVVATLAGGMLIGLASSLLLATEGRIAGISGILAGIMRPNPENWRVRFIVGMVTGGVLLALLFPTAVAGTLTPSTGIVVGAGLLVGIGTRLGSGCTSGHGVCGLPRMSRRSIVATATFMSTAALSTYIVLHVL